MSAEAVGALLAGLSPDTNPYYTLQHYIHDLVVLKPTSGLYPQLMIIICLSAFAAVVCVATVLGRLYVDKTSCWIVSTNVLI